MLRDAHRVAPGLGLACLLVALAGRAHANDTAVDYSGGQLTFKRADGIVMEDELLTISSDWITVAYVFRNVSDRDVETEVGFPIQVAAGRRHAEEEGADPLPATWQPFTKNVADFEVLVDGKRQPFRSIARATDEETEFVHLWRQRFPAGATVRVSHKYRASPDGLSISGTDVESRRELAKLYCVGPKLAVARHEAAITRVRYVLTTGANWSGPIRHFHLVLKKTKPQQKVSLCLEGLVKTSPTTFELDRRDFTPTADLRLIFFE